MTHKRKTPTKHEEILQALATLRTVGMLNFEHDHFPPIHTYKAVGAALAFVEQSASVPARLAHEFWEQHNYHELAALMRWVFPDDLNPSHVTYREEAEQIQELINCEEIVLLDADGKAKSYTVTLAIEETHVDMIASGYDWICPHCDNENHEIEALNDVQCKECRTHYTINPPEHAYE